MAFTFEKTKIPGVVIIQPKVFGDNRGYFLETYKKDDYVAKGINREFVQDNESSEDGLPIPPYALYNIGGGQPENLLDYVSTLQEELVRAGVLPEDYDFEGHRELVGMQPGDVPVTYADSKGLEDYGFCTEDRDSGRIKEVCGVVEGVFKELIMDQEEAKKYLQDNQKSVLEKCGKILGREISIQSFNGLFGGKNRVYNVDAVNYKTPEEYVDAWNKSQKEIKARDNADYENSIQRIDLLLKDEEISNYVNAFLTRTYYRKTKGNN